VGTGFAPGIALKLERRAFPAIQSAPETLDQPAVFDGIFDVYPKRHARPCGGHPRLEISFS